MLAASHFNADYYMAIATIAPIFLLALVVQLRVSDMHWMSRRDLGWVRYMLVADATYLVVSLLLDEGCAMTALKYRSTDAFIRGACSESVWGLPAAFVAFVASLEPREKTFVADRKVTDRPMTRMDRRNAHSVRVGPF